MFFCCLLAFCFGQLVLLRQSSFPKIFVRTSFIDLSCFSVLLRFALVVFLLSFLVSWCFLGSLLSERFLSEPLLSTPAGFDCFSGCCPCAFCFLFSPVVFFAAFFAFFFACWCFIGSRLSPKKLTEHLLSTHDVFQCFFGLCSLCFFAVF